MRLNGANSNFQPSLHPQDEAYTSSQLSSSAHQQSFAREASSPTAALTLLGAGLSYQVGRTATWALFSNSSFRILPRVLAPMVGLHLEVASIHATHHLSGTSLATEHSSAYRSFYSTLLDIGGLKGIGVLGASFSAPLRHLLQSAGTVGLHRLASAIGLIPASHESNIFRELLDAEIVNLQMETSAALGNRLGMLRLNQLQRTLQLRENIISARSSGGLQNPISVMASHEMAPLVEMTRPSRAVEYFESRGLSFVARWIRAARLWNFERKLKQQTQRIRCQQVNALLTSLNHHSTSESQANFLVEALKRSYPHLNDDSAQRCAETCLRSFPNSPFQTFLMRTLGDIFPHLQSSPAVRLNIMKVISKSVLAPFPRLGDVAYQYFNPSLAYLDRPELLELARYTATLDFHPVASVERVQGMLDQICDRLQITRRENQINEGRLEEARILGRYLAHNVFGLSLVAHRRLVSILQEVTEPEGVKVLNNISSDFSKDFLTNLRWVEEFEKRRVKGNLSSLSWIRNWEEQRYSAQMKVLRDRLSVLQIPQGWSEMGTRISTMNGLEDFWNLQNSMRARFTSQANGDRAVAQTWWNQANMEERLLILQICVGSRAYWKLRGREALRLRNLASQGLESETGIASKNPEIRDEDEVLFVLGNHNTVAVPLGFIEEFGISEAAEYLMIHHTHPSHGKSDFNEIYPSSHIEGTGSGDLYSMIQQQEILQHQKPLAYSVSHAQGGSIFTIREEEGRRHLNIYTGVRNSKAPFDLNHRVLVEVRNRIRNFSQQNGLEVHFWEVPFAWVENMHYPSQRSQNSQFDPGNDPARPILN